MSSSDAQQFVELKTEMQEMKAKIEKLEKEVRELKKDHQQQRIICRCRRGRNLPAELKVEIVDCLPLENAVHFLANVPNRLIIHHCAPRIRRILKMIDQIAAYYARTLPAPDSDGHIRLRDGHKYTPEIAVFLRHGAAHCNNLSIWDGTISFIAFPASFFNDLIKHYSQTKVPAKAVRSVLIQLPLANPPPWPAALVQPQAGEEVNNDEKCVKYILRNEHNPGIVFELYIFFEGEAKCYQQMTRFEMWRV